MEEDYKDRLPRHEEMNDPSTLEHQPGQWRIYTRKEYWDINGRRTDKDVFEGDVVTQILKNMELEYETENDMVSDGCNTASFKQRHKKTGLQDFLPRLKQTGLYSYRRKLES